MNVGKALSRVADIVLGLVVLAVLFLLGRPGGPLATSYTSWKEDRQRVQVVRSEWPELSQASTVLGDPGNEVEIVIFSDYECPFCRSSHGAVEEFLAENPTASVAIRHLPLSEIHPSAEEGAFAVICAGHQGRSLQMNRILMTEDAWQATNDWRLWADRAGVESASRFDTCMGSEEVRNLVERDIEWARRMNVSATPTFISPHVIHRGGVETAEELAAMIR